MLLLENICVHHTHYNSSEELQWIIIWCRLECATADSTVFFSLEYDTDSLMVRFTSLAHSKRSMSSIDSNIESVLYSSEIRIIDTIICLFFVDDC